MQELMKITKTLLRANGEDEDLKNPIKIELVIDESIYDKIKETAKECNLSVYEAIYMLLERSDEFIHQI